MEPISSADRLVMVLRQKLQERLRTRGTASGATASAPSKQSRTRGVAALAAIEGADERQLRRAVIENLLIDQLGPALTNSSQFQQIVSRVTSAIEDDDDTARMLTLLVAQLRT